MRKLRRKEHMKQKLKRFMAGFMAMLTLVGTLFTNGTTAFAASPQANIAFWNASVKNSGEVSELKPGYNHGKILYSILDGNSAYCMNFGLRADGGQLMNSYDDASTSMSAQQRKLLSYCLYYGFNSTQKAAPSNSQCDEYIATQAMVWVIVADIFGTGSGDSAARKLCNTAPSPDSSYSYYERLRDNISSSYNATLPSFASRRTSEAPTYELKWNESNQRFETTLSDSNGVLSDFDFGISGYSVDKNGNIVMVTAQRPPEKSTLMADYDTWKKVGRYVKRGAKGCAIFPSRALNPRMRYIFDISDTGGKNVKLTWDLEGENLKDYLDFLVSEGQIEQYDNSDRESLKNILKQFTGTDVWLIIKEEFGDRMTELMQLSGSVIKEESKKRNGLQQEMDMEQLVYASVMYAVGTRCGFDLSVQEQDFSQIVNIKDEEIIYRLGSIVCDVSCSVLREFSRNLKAIESERRIGYVRRNDLQGSGRTALSADRDAGRDGGSHEAGQIRKDGDELSKGERAGKIQDADEIREDVREDVSGRGGSEPAVRPAGDAVSGEAQATESVIDNGDVEDKRAGEDAGRGSGTPSDSDAIPLESDDTELNRELDEINSLGVSKEAEYTQASFFFDQNGQASIGTIHTEDENNNQFMRQFEQDRKAALAGKYNYLNPKKSATVPGEYIKQVLMRGTGFVGGKGRVCKIFETEIDAGTRAKRIKAEYGQGGAGWPVDGLGLHGYDTFHGNGLRFQWRDEDGEVEGYVSWKDIEKELGVLILTGEYQPETPRIDELAMDGLREDDEVIDSLWIINAIIINEKYRNILVIEITIYFATKNLIRLCPLAIAILIVESVYSLEKKMTENIRTISQKNTV